MDIRVSLSDPQTTAAPVPDFPWVRYDTGRLSYNEALIEGRWLFSGSSALGRPMTRMQVHREAHPRNQGVMIPYPWHPRESWESAFRITVDGQLLADRWEWVGEGEVKSPRLGCREHVVTLHNLLRPVTAKLFTRLDDTPFITRWIELTNTGKHAAAVSEAYTWSGRLWTLGGWPEKPIRGEPAFEIGRFTQYAWGREGDFAWEPLPRGMYSISNSSGTSGWSEPFCMIRNNSTGEIVIADLAWSGNWALEVLNDDQRHGTNRRVEVYLRAGISGPAPLRVLAPGESVTLPPFHLGHVFGDLDAASQALHDHLRRSVLPSLPEGVPNLVCSNHYGYTESESVTDDYLLDEIAVAAEIGAELFLVDAGWFGDGKGNFVTQVGDWTESPLLKRGFKSIVDETHRRGLKFGLWVEIERMTEVTNLAKEHPEWFLKRRGCDIKQLNLALPEVERHVHDTLVGLIETYKLDLLRLDYNILQVAGGEREVAGAADGAFMENTQWRYYDALYRIFEDLHRRYPKMLLENCASGGGRNDLGMLSRFHWTQGTDNWEPQGQLKIFNGTTLALPPERVMPILGAVSPGVADVDFMLRPGLFGHFCACGSFPSPREIHKESLPRWRHAIDLYKTFVRPWLHSSRLYHHTPILRENTPGDWCALELVSPDRSRAIACVWRLPDATGDHYHLRPRGLDLSRKYKVTSDNTGQSYLADGASLTNSGITVPVRATGTSELLLFEAT